VKIVSLLPSATEIVYALGLADALEGVSFECDYPPGARGKRARGWAVSSPHRRPRMVGPSLQRGALGGRHDRAAGGSDVVGEPGRPSRRLQWSEVAVSAPEVVIFMPCGYGLNQAVGEGKGLLKLPELRPASQPHLRRVCDGLLLTAWSAPG
jgi:hypothetical protein